MSPFQNNTGELRYKDSREKKGKDRLILNRLANTTVQLKSLFSRYSQIAGLLPGLPTSCMSEAKFVLTTHYHIHHLITP